MENPTCCRYGGVILESNYKDVPFGEPAAVIRLGSTLRPSSRARGVWSNMLPTSKNMGSDMIDVTFMICLVFFGD